MSRTLKSRKRLTTASGSNKTRVPILELLRNTPLSFECLEPRINPSANNLLAQGIAATPFSLVPLSSFAAFVQTQQAPTQVVIIDGAVPNYAQLVNTIGTSGLGASGAASASSSSISVLPQLGALSLPASSSGAVDASATASDTLLVARRGGTEFVVLDRAYSGIQQITDILQPLHGLISEQVLSHGGPGELLLGDTILDQTTLQQDQAQVSAWGKALQPGGDILLYGCDVAQGTDGVQFVQNLAHDTGANVAANTKATGGTALGGDWNLDYRTGPIEAQPVFTTAADSSYGSLLGIGTDLKTYISDLLASESASFSQTQTINTASLGGFLQLNTLTLTENATLSPGGVWSGTIGLSAVSAALFPGDSFSAAITSSVANQAAITGTFTIGSTSGADFTLTVPSTANLVMNVGEALTITASNVSFNYDSTGADNQTLATIQTATVTSTQFSAMPSATLSDFALRADGFSFAGFTLSSAQGAAPSIGNFLTTTGVTLDVSNFNVSFGTSENPTPTLSGTVGVTVSGLQLFPTGNYVQLATTGVTAEYNFANFDGTDPTGQLTVTVSGFQLNLGQALELSAGTTPVVLTPDQAVLATIGTVTLSSPEFSGLGTFTVSNLEIQQEGFSLGSLEWSSTGPVTVGSEVLSFASVTVDLNNFAVQYGASPSVSGSVSFAATGGALFPNVPVLNVSLGSISGGFDFGNATNPGLMNVQINNLDISLGDAFTINLGSVDLTPGQTTMLSAANVMVTANLFTGLPSFALPTFDLTQTGFSLGDFTIPVTSNITIGNFLAFSDVSIAVNDFAVDTQSNPVISGSITATLGTMTLFPGNTLVTSSFTDVVGTYDFASTSNPGQFSLTIGTFNLSLFGQISVAASNVTITPDQSTLATIGSAMLSFAPLDNLGITVQNLAIEQTGFTIASASVNLPDNLTLGSLLTLTTPTVTLTNIAYTLGGTLSGTVDFSATGATLQFGSALDASVGQSNGSYNLATEMLSLTFSNFSLSLADFADITASTITLTYTPATDGTSEFLVGATGVGVFMGTGTAPNQVGVNVTNGTLAVAIFDSAGGTITYALDITGTAAILGLPANSISVTPGAIEFRDNTAGAVATMVPDGTTSIPLSFTGDETDVLATGLGISVGNFASITGDFGFSEFTVSGGDTYLAIGAENVTATVSAGGVSVNVTGASLGLLIDTTSMNPTYALVASGGTDSLTGVPGLTLTGTGLAVRVRSGLDPSTVSSQLPSGVITPDGTVSLDFSSLGSGTSDITDVEGTVSLAIANFVTISGSFGFEQFTDNGATYLAVGASGVDVVLGNSTTNLTLTQFSLGLVVQPGTGGSATTYALEATGNSASLIGVPDLHLSGSNIVVLVRNGLNVSGDTSIPSSVQTPGGPVTLDFSDLGSGTTDVADIEGDLTLSITGFGSLMGDFGFQSYTDPATGLQQIAVGATNVTATVGTTSTYLQLLGGSLGLVIEPGTTTTTETDTSDGTTASISLQNPAIPGTVVVAASAPESDTTTSASGVAAGSVAVTPAVMEPYIVVGAYLEINQGQSDQETVKVSAVTATTFTAAFAQAHSANFTIADAVTTSASSVAAGSVVVTPAVMEPYIVVGANLEINQGQSDQEIVTVSAVTATTFTATFAQAHDAGFTIAPAKILVAGTDYTVATDTSGNTTVNFINIPAAGTTINTTYTYLGGPAIYALEATASNVKLVVPGLTLNSGNLMVEAREGLDLSQASGLPVVQTSGGSVPLNFSGLGAGTSNELDVEGQVSLTVANFVTLSGAFGLQTHSTASDTYLAMGMDGSVSLTAGMNTLTLANVSIGLLVDQGTAETTYALQASEGSDPADTTFTGPDGLSLSASNLLVLVDDGLDLSTYPSGVPTAVSVPAITQSTTDPVTIAGSDTTSITLLHAAVAGTVVVTATPSGGTPVTLVAGTDYTLGTDTSGNTTITFINVPAAGTTISTSYTFVRQPASTISLDFGSLPTGTTTVTEIEGNVSIAVAGFASLSGDFGIEEYTPSSGDPVLLIGATNVSAVLGTTDTNVTVTGASFGLIMRDGYYALLASGGTIALNGVSDLNLTATSLQVEVDNGLASAAGAPTSITTPGGNVDLTALFSLVSTNTNTTLEEIQVTGSIAVFNFASLSGTFSFTETTAADADNMGTTTMILVGASDVDAFIGADGYGAQISEGTLGLVIYRDSEASGSTYALDASGMIAVVGLPTEVQLTGTANVAINTTGKAVNQTIPGVSQPVSFADGTNVESFGGSLNLTITPASGTSFSLGGEFSFTEEVAGNISKLLVGATNISAPSITADAGGAFSLTNGTLGMVFYTDNTTDTFLGYALSASATATATAGNSSLGGTLTILRNTTTTADFPDGVNDTVTVGATTIPVVFTAAQEGTPTAAFQTIVISNASLNIDNNLLITASQGSSSTPVAGASSLDLTGVTLTVQASSSEPLFTVSAGSAVLTTFSGTVTASQATSNGLSARQDGSSWESGDKDLELTNVTFTIGSYVSFTAASIDLQHYTNSSNATVDSFIFNTATLALLNNGQPLVSLTGSPTFDYVTGSGFMLDPNSAPFTGFTFLDPTYTLGPLTLVSPSVGLSNFSFDLSGQLTATVSINAAMATIGAGPSQRHSPPSPAVSTWGCNSLWATSPSRQKS